jgi:hypothetical protein
MLEARDDSAQELMRAYLVDRDAECPSCRYNLRGCEAAACPECRTVIPFPAAGVDARMDDGARVWRRTIAWLKLASMLGLLVAIWWGLSSTMRPVGQVLFGVGVSLAPSAVLVWWWLSRKAWMERRGRGRRVRLLIAVVGSAVPLVVAALSI